MIDIFGKKKIAKLESEIAELENDLERLTRIVHNAKDEPSFKLVTNTSLLDDIDYILYLYIDKEEYIIPIQELHYHNSIQRRSARLTVNDNCATFTIDGEICGASIIYKFIIDYLQGKYVCTKSVKGEVEK